MKISALVMIPAHTRNAVNNRAAGHCEDCGNRARLELHHLRYWTDPDSGNPCGDPIDGKETPDDLAALCRECHHSRHIDVAGDFWRNPEEMEVYWSTYHVEADAPGI